MNSNELQEFFTEIEKNCEILKKQLPDEVNTFELCKWSRIPFKVKTIEGVLLHRIYDLGIDSLSLYKKNKKLQSIMIIRSVQESVAVLFLITEKIEKCVNRKSLGNIDSFLIKCLFGCKIDPIKKTTPIHIMDAIRCLDRRIPGSQTAYDVISEYVHPNGPGTFGCYGNLDESVGTYSFGPKYKNESFLVGIHNLSAFLKSTNYIINIINDNFDDFTELCEIDGKKNKST